MRVSAIKQQKRAGRYSIFVDGDYAFSLSDNALLTSKLTLGQELSAKQVSDYKRLSADDKIYGRVLRYVALRPRSTWEVDTYLKRKDASPALIKTILNKLSEIELLDDYKVARAYITDKHNLSPTSRRKIIMGLRKKHIPEEVISQALNDTQVTDHTALRSVIARKRRQTKYQDDLKLMQYLARQGFNYSDIKDELRAEPED